MKAVVFLTLFLGLTAGPHRVEVAVDETRVAAVELRLDGETVQRFSGPPWLAGVDFGAELAPHRLAAVALDADGGEVGRTEQWVNLPRGEAEARLLLEREGARVSGARLGWDSLEDEAPAAMAVTFDGEPLEVADPPHIALPEHDPDVLHVLSAEVVFPSGSSARADVAFGGPFGGETGAALTAVPVEVEGRRRLRRAEEAEGWLAVDGRPVPVLALDRGEVDVFAVLDRSADPHLQSFGVAMARRVGARRQAPHIRTEDATADPNILPRRRVNRMSSPLLAIGLRPEDRLFLVRPTADASRSGYLLFGISLPIEGSEGGLAWLLTYLRMEEGEDPGPQRLADAVATAGLRAAASGRPRGVVLVLGPGTGDASRFEARQARRFLRRLRVPLEVWYVERVAVSLELARKAAQEAAAEAGSRADAPLPEPPGLEAVEAARRRRLARAREAWGEVRDVESLTDWIEVADEYREDLARQRVLWIDGVHPPSAVDLADAPSWVRLADAPEPGEEKAPAP